MYPIQEYFDAEISSGAYGWNCKPWLNRWRFLEDMEEGIEKEKFMKKATSERNARFLEIYFKNLNKSINKRYRENGFGINFLLFDRHDICSFIEKHSEDEVFYSGLDFKTHITQREDGTYPYPNPNYIVNQLGDVSELRLAGFHMWDCVDKVASTAFEKGISTLVDEDLTEFFHYRCKQDYFRVDNYPNFNPFKNFGDDLFLEHFFEVRKKRKWLLQREDYEDMLV